MLNSETNIKTVQNPINKNYTEISNSNEQKSPAKRLKTISNSHLPLYLIIDNFDSFTYNLFQLFSIVSGREPIVIYNNAEQSSVETLLKVVDAVIISPGPGSPDISEDIGICHRVFQNFDGPILGICMGMQILNSVYGGKITLAKEPIHGRHSNIYFNTLTKNFENLTKVNLFLKQFNNFNNTTETHFLFKNMICPFRAVRYNSLICDLSFVNKEEIEILCFSLDKNEDVEIMGLAHRSKPFFGLQFHPESICTTDGRQIIENFNEFVKNKYISSNLDVKDRSLSKIQSEKMLRNFNTKPTLNQFLSTNCLNRVKSAKETCQKNSNEYFVLYRELKYQNKNDLSKPFKKRSNNDQMKLPQIFEQLFSKSTYCFQLESSKREDMENSRFSYMGTGDGPLSELYEFSLNSRELRFSSHTQASHQQDTRRRQKTNTRKLKPDENFFIDFLEPQLNSRYCNSNINIESLCDTFNNFDFTTDSAKMKGILKKLEDKSSLTNFMQTSESFPFDFNCGFVGYIGYEMKKESENILNISTSSKFDQQILQNNLNKTRLNQDLDSQNSNKYDTRLLLSDCTLVCDHLTNSIFLLSLCKTNNSKLIESSVNWICKTSSAILDLQSGFEEESVHIDDNSSNKNVANKLLTLTNNRDKDERIEIGRKWEKHFDVNMRLSESQYLQCIDKAIDYIRNGQCYELCLTTQISNCKPVKLKPFDLYMNLRRTNPAPYSAYIKFSDDLSIVCSSPELFLKIDKFGQAKCKPIKGTLPRGQTPEEDRYFKHLLSTNEKEMSENLMIVDLMRNDLGRVCKVGSVTVPKLMNVESYSTVHQLVSTVRGKLLDNVSAVRCFGSVFPPGSMTGAPKVRAMQLLESMEAGKRGIYSGSIGYFGLNGSAVLNVVIRTILFQPHLTNIQNHSIDKNDLQDYSIGSGGAIVALSDCHDEYVEMLVKTKAPLQSIFDISVAENGQINGESKHKRHKKFSSDENKFNYQYF